MTRITTTLENVMGDDLDVVKAAKVSFDNDKSVEPIAWRHVTLSPLISRDQPVLTERQTGLIKYLVRGMPSAEYESMILAAQSSRGDAKDVLWRFRNTPIHAAPFGHCFLSFTVHAPVFVARQLVKHEYLRMSEVSRRYIKGAPEYFTPDNWSSIAQEVKQGSGAHLLPELNDDAETLANTAIDTSDRMYKAMLKFVSPEEARIVLPLCHMTRWRWSGSLDAFMNMCKMRLDNHAQSQTRIVAKQIGEYIKLAFPQSWASYVDGDI